MSRSAVFFDKDGTLVRNVPYNVDPDQVELVAGASRALDTLRSLGFTLLVVSNQSGVARGMYTTAEVESAWKHTLDLLHAEGARVDDFAYCPHHPSGTVEEFTGDCACRKPAPGLLVDIAKRHGVDLASSWMVGDILDDVEAGHRAGCRSLLVDNGGETEWDTSGARAPHGVVKSLREAVDAILLETVGGAL